MLNWGGGAVLLRIPLCVLYFQSMDQTRRVIKNIICINIRWDQRVKLVLNEENINDISCIDSPAAETICVSLQ